MSDWRELAGDMPLQKIAEALDDDNDGEADAVVWDAVQAGADARVADAFGGPVPERHAGAVPQARRLFLLETLYGRRGFSGDKNPFSGRAAKAAERLRRLATGDETPQGAEGGGSVFSEPAKVAGVGGLMA